jgi:hypothetical protein
MQSVAKQKVLPSLAIHGGGRNNDGGLVSWLPIG